MSVSEKQKAILAFPYTDYDSLICEGAIRTGKTMFMAVAFFDWAMDNFDGCNFIVMGKSVGSAWRNVIDPYTAMTWCQRKYAVKQRRSSGSVVISRGKRSNTFYVFGAKDESSFQLIQGITAAGCLIDEAAICVESAVNQALARCSVKGARYWWNCNPSYPTHWFKKNWIDRAEENNALVLHFDLGDNPSLDAGTIARYERQYTGVFYDRYIRGLWVQAEGIIYAQYREALEKKYEGPLTGYALSIDYGTLNPFAAQKWGMDPAGVWHCTEEYHHSGRETGRQKTDEDYVRDMVAFTADAPIGELIDVIVDPSAASLIAAMRRCQEREFRVIPAMNEVVEGIANTAVCIQQGYIKVAATCKRTIEEFESYVWDEGKANDTPVKENDHHMDAIRYFVQTKRLVRGQDGYVSRLG